MELNYIVVSIQKILISAGGNLPLADILEQLGITRRILDYNLKKLNYALRINNLPQIEVVNDRLLLNMSYRDEIRDAILLRSTGSEWEYILSPEERKSLILLSIGLIKNLTLDVLAEMIDTSRNTTMHDIAQIKSVLEEEDLSLISRKKCGYILEGDELNIRYCLYKSVAENHTDHMQSRIDDIFLTAVGIKTGAKPKGTLFNDIRQIVKDAEYETGLIYNSNAIDELAYYILLILCRAKTEILFVDEEGFIETAEYKAAGIIIANIENIGLQIPHEEKVYLTAVMLSERGNGADIRETYRDVDLQSFVMELIEEFEGFACVQMDEREAFANQLLLHIRPMYYRLKYKIKVTNINASDVKSEYPDIFLLTRKAVKRIEQKYGMSINEDETAYICIYFVSWMAHRKIKKSKEGKCILIMCGAGIGTALFLQHQISELVGRRYIIDTKDLRNASESDVVTYDLIVSTVDLPYKSDKILRTDAVLSPMLRNIILNRFPPDSMQSEDTIVSDILYFIDQNAVITNRAKLVLMIRKYLESIDVGHRKVHLKDVLTPDMVVFFPDPLDQEEAIHAVCHPLVKAGMIGRDYAESIIRTYERLGLYSEISPGILLAHAHPSLDVKGVGLVLGVFKQGILFGKGEKEAIKIILALCTKDNNAHLMVLHNLIRLLDDAEFVRTLKDGEFVDSSDLFSFVSKRFE